MTTLQNYCLQVMGITQWQLRSNTEESSEKPYLLLLDEALTDEKNQLLARLLQAMQWQGLSRIECVQANDNIHEKISKAQKVVIFGQNLAKQVAQSNVIVSIPSVQEMLENVDAKKRAWGILKVFM